MGKALYHDGACTCAIFANLTQKVGLPGRGILQHFWPQVKRDSHLSCEFISVTVVRGPATQYIMLP